MKISVITVCYNSEKTIEDTIKSVLSQTHEDIEYIIVDGDSRDSTMDIVRKYASRIGTIVSEPDCGVYDAMNKGIALATGEAIAFINSDDIYASETIVEDISRVLRDENLDSCYGDLVYVDPLNMEKIVRYWRSRPYQPGLCKKGWMPAHPTFVVRKWVYERYGGFDTEFNLQADFELTTRFLHVHGISSVYIPKILVRMRMGGVTNSSFANVIRGNIEAYRACRKNGLKVGPIFVVRKILSRLPQFFTRPEPQTNDVSFPSID